MMLQKVYIKIKNRKVNYFYIESKNFNFSMERVFDKDFNQITIDKKVFERSKDLIIHNLHFPQDDTYIGDEYDLALGSLIRTPEELI